jgi:hypothetical protein
LSPYPWQCKWHDSFLQVLDTDVLPHFSLEEALAAASASYPLKALLAASSNGTILHQSWANRCIPEKWASFVATWAGQPKVTKYILWTDDTMDQLIVDIFSCTTLGYVWRYLTSSQNSKEPNEAVKRSDIFRFLVIFVFGGMYADLDMVARGADVTELQRATTIVWEPMSAQQLYHMNTTSARDAASALRHDGRLVLITFLVAASRGDPFIRYVLNHQIEWQLIRAVAETRRGDAWWDFRRVYLNNAVAESGPSVVARAYHSYVQRQGSGANLTTMTSDEVNYWAVHENSCSWCPGNKINWKTARCIDISELVPSSKLELPFKALIKPSSSESIGHELLWVQALNGNLPAVKKLAKNADNIDAPNKDACTPLLLAAERGHEAVVQFLISRGASLASSDRSGRHPLYVAAANGHEGVVRLLLAKRCDPSKPGPWFAGRNDTAKGASERYGYSDITALLNAAIRERS